MKKVLLKLIALFLIANIPVALYNYIFDPYGIFHDRSLRIGYEPGYEPNQRYAKIRHLINDDHSWDSYLFGSSRVGKIDPDLISGGKYYNMNYSEGVPGEHLADIRILLEKGIPVKNVMIGLDNFSYTVSPEEHDGQIMRHGYDTSLIKRIPFLIRYLGSVPRFSIMKYIGQTMDDSMIIFDVPGNGMQRLERIDEKIERNIEEHVNGARFKAVGKGPFDNDTRDVHERLMEDALRDIAGIVKLSRERGFNLYIFMNPLHKLYYLSHDPELFLSFKERLAGITDYWDFSGFNSITTDNYYYYETSHYRPLVGDMIICRITGCKNAAVQEDFGVFITRDNVSAFIDSEKKELEAYERADGGKHQ